MADRFDIMEAWYLFLGHYHQGQGCELYARLSKLTSYFDPRPGLAIGTLSEEGRRIYIDLMVDEDERLDIPRVDDYGYGGAWFYFHIGPYSNKPCVYIRAKYMECAIEAFIDWCDENEQMGAFVGVTEADILAEINDPRSGINDPLLRRGAELSMKAGDWDDPVLMEAREAAEADLHMVGHTTLQNWDYENDGMPGLAHDVSYGEVSPHDELLECLNIAATRDRDELWEDE